MVFMMIYGENKSVNKLCGLISRIKVFKPIRWNRFCNTSEYVEGLSYMVMELWT